MSSGRAQEVPRNWGKDYAASSVRAGNLGGVPGIRTGYWARGRVDAANEKPSGWKEMVQGEGRR